jgi:hypothetical protein
MINLEWGGLTNGQIDTRILVDVSGKGDYLESTAAHQFLAMRDALHAATGIYINPAPGSSAYRPLATQQQFYAAYQAGTGNVAAVPGTSNHGWGRAIDITGYESSDAVWAWLLAHASEFGYSWATGQASGERWHWESLTAPGAASAASTNATSIPTEVLHVLENGNMLLITSVGKRSPLLIGPLGSINIVDQGEIDALTGTIGAKQVNDVQLDRIRNAVNQYAANAKVFLTGK